MADYKKVIPFHKAWEGGLSRATTDKAASNPSPWTYNGQTGWHTNKGITYAAFVACAPKIGYQITPENFFTMPDAIWNSIFKIIYWDGMLLDRVNSEAIAAALSNWSWGSGDSGAFQLLKKYLATKGYNVTNDAQAVDAINELSRGNEEAIFLELIDWRENYFRSLNQPANLQGWLNRLKFGSGTKPSMMQFGLNLIKKKGL